MEHALYLSAIKKALKARNVSYAELAEDLNMTESGIKKMLNAKDISFRRILQICEVLQILPGQLFAFSEKAQISEVEFTERQQEALIKNRTLLAVYWRFAVEKHSLVEIEKLQRLSKADVKKMMEKLVALDLAVAYRGSYRARHSGKFKWSDKTKLAKMFNREWSELTLQRALAGDDSTHRLVGMKLSKESLQKCVDKIQAALNEAVQESEREELTTAAAQLQNCTLLFAATPYGVFDDSKI
ncbi:helix-turn-helix domain-containing protein [Bdellovibrio bacteriovorus]|uniref:helix-turn-helix domain-containing protein n=1 Tax=Bdellovibrio bacteriovorus TaxID=959 RepID=UPI0035A67DF6